MSCAALIRKDETHFNLAHRIISVIVEQNNLDFDETWNLVSTNSIQQLQKRFRRLKRANNPLSKIKKPRTSFSFYTKNCRAKIAEANPKATFGELSKLVSKSWSGLNKKERNIYKKMEDDDKLRYAKEKDEILANLENNPQPVVEETDEDIERELQESSSRKGKGKGKGSKSTKETESTSETTEVTTKSKGKGKGKGKAKGKTKGKEKKTSKTSPYDNFQKQHRALIKKENPNMVLKEVNTKLGSMWKGLSEEERSQYIAA